MLEESHSVGETLEQCCRSVSVGEISPFWRIMTAVLEVFFMCLKPCKILIKVIEFFFKSFGDSSAVKAGSEDYFFYVTLTFDPNREVIIEKYEIKSRC